MTLSLRSKVLCAMVSLVLFLGITSAFVTRSVLYKVLKTEFRNKGLIHARSISANSIADVLTQNTPRLNKLLENEKKLSLDTAYIFIVDSSKSILAHTFLNGFPINLLAANGAGQQKDFSVQLLDTQIGVIYDICVPIISDKSLVGQIRLGVHHKEIQKTIRLIDSIILLATLITIMLGILSAYKISSLITRPISKLVQATEAIQNGNFSIQLEANSNDEIGVLSGAFNKMAGRLNQMIKEVERLTKYQERRNIAFDLHDNCAQDLSNMMKRIELCQRLFKLDPQKAVEELKDLRDNIQSHLIMARQAISSYKDPENNDFNLSDKIRQYLNDFKRHNDIAVKLNISKPFANITPDKSRQIFNIITEALTNAEKHTQAKNVEVQLEYNDSNEMLIKIKDNGSGFDIDNAESNPGGSKLGLASMRQRAVSLGGSFYVDSKPYQGTEITVRIPAI